MFNPRFIHLHVHSDYSIIDGISKIDTLVKHAIFLNMPALAITDFNNLFGVIKFYNISYDLGIKPIIGADFVISDEISSKKFYDMTILAANNTGYQNLKLLISRGYQKKCENTTGPIINYEWLTELNDGLIILSGGYKGDIGQYLIHKTKEKIEQRLIFYNHYFCNRFYLEITRTGNYNEENYLECAIELANKQGLPVVATNNVRFAHREDFDAHEIRVAIHNRINLNDVKYKHIYSNQQFMRSEAEMCRLFSDFPESLSNTVEIAKRCNVTIDFNKYFVPKFPTGHISTKSFLIMSAKSGLEKRLQIIFPNNKDRLKKRSIYDDRLKMELNVINNMGFPGYFLIVMEFINWAKKNNIPVGPGRGSGAGSLVAYALKITDINPLFFNLLFERFLNNERISMPDLDIDFCMLKRDLVIDHVIETYGKDSVSQIITFSTMTARAVIRDVGRVLGYTYSFVDSISKLIPSEFGITLNKAIMTTPQLKNIYNTNDDVKKLIDMSYKLEGTIKNIGKHAGGVVISPTKITDFSPLYLDNNSHYYMTQFDKNDIERIGLVKFDFLGLRTLTIINWTINMINISQVNNGLTLVNINNIPLNDKKSFQFLLKAETNAIFQLESNGMQKLIKRLKPDCFEDIVALLALFRPGPLQSGMVDNFINRKHKKEAISYPDIQWQHELLKPILESTYGIILYQEQVMQIAQVLAGYTLGKADILRRAMSTKKIEEMSKQRITFRKGSESRGINTKLSMKIFDLLEKFAGYGFNKSHSVAYATLSYQTLWLKTHYPAEFMASVLNADITNAEKIVNTVDECHKMKLKILPPNINISKYYFYVNDAKEIIYGMGAIKGLGIESIKAILQIRKINKRFTTLLDVCKDIDNKKINKRILKILIMSGSCDCFGVPRDILKKSIEQTISIANQYKQNISNKQKDMFQILPVKPVTNISHINDIYLNKEILEEEKKTLGFYLTDNPIFQYLKEIENFIKITKIIDIFSKNIKKNIYIFGSIISERILFTKNGKYIGSYVLDDQSGRLDIILYSNLLNKYQSYLKKEAFILVNGQINTNYFTKKNKLIVHEIMDIHTIRTKYVKKLIISLNDKQVDDKFLNSLKLSLEPFKSGNIPVYIYYTKNKKCTKLFLGDHWKIFITDKLLYDLSLLIGYKQIKLAYYS